MELTIVLILSILLAGFIKGAIGFGLSLILLAVLFEAGIPPSQFLPIMVPIFVVLDILLFIENRKHVHMNFRENFTLHYTTLMSLFLGILLGTYLLMVIDPIYLKITFAFLVLLVIFFLIGKVSEENMIVPGETSNSFFGFGTGILTGLLTINAIPPSLYLIYYQYKKEKYMGALVTFLIVSDILLVAVYMFKELFTLALIKTSLILVAICLGGFFIGVIVRRFIPSSHFKTIVILILVLNSVKILFDFFF